jgi:uncharacterized protein (UPF0332 family)
MSIQEQTEIKTKYYNEAIRYMDNAKEYLKNAKKEGNYYHDAKYVKTACGTAYNGLLMALDCFLILKGIQKPKRSWHTFAILPMAPRSFPSATTRMKKRK